MYVRYLIPTCLKHTTMIDCDETMIIINDCCITNDDDDDDDDDDDNVTLHCNSRCNIETHLLPTKSMCRCIPDVPRSYTHRGENRGWGIAFPWAADVGHRPTSLRTRIFLSRRTRPTEHGHYLLSMSNDLRHPS